MTEQTKQKIAMLLAMGFSIRGVALECGIHAQTLHNGISGTATSARTEQKIVECFNKFVGIRIEQVEDAKAMM